MIQVHLRDVEPDDLPVFFEHQRDEDATRLAGVPARDRAAFEVHWATKIVGYWLGRERGFVAERAERGEVAGAEVAEVVFVLG